MYLPEVDLDAVTQLVMEFHPTLDDVFNRDAVSQFLKMQNGNERWTSLVKDWNSNPTDKKKYLRIWVIYNLVIKNEPPNSITSVSDQEWTSIISKWIEDERKSNLYDNIGNLKLLAVQLFPELEDEIRYYVDIETIRNLIKKVFLAKYNRDVRENQNPDPLQWQDFVGDLSK